VLRVAAYQYDVRWENGEISNNVRACDLELRDSKPQPRTLLGEEVEVSIDGEYHSAQVVSQLPSVVDVVLENGHIITDVDALDVDDPKSGEVTAFRRFQGEDEFNDCCVLQATDHLFTLELSQCDEHGKLTRVSGVRVGDLRSRLISREATAPVAPFEVGGLHYVYCAGKYHPGTIERVYPSAVQLQWTDGVLSADSFRMADLQTEQGKDFDEPPEVGARVWARRRDGVIEAAELKAFQSYAYDVCRITDDEMVLDSFQRRKSRPDVWRGVRHTDLRKEQDIPIDAQESPDCDAASENRTATAEATLDGCPRFALATDNLNVRIQPTAQTMKHGPRSHNLMHTLAFQQAIPLPVGLDDQLPQLEDADKLSLLSFVPSDPSMKEKMLHDYMHTVVQWWLADMSVFTHLRRLEPRPPRHKYSAEQRKKTEFHSLGVDRLDEQKNADMMKLLKKFQRLVPKCRLGNRCVPLFSLYPMHDVSCLRIYITYCRYCSLYRTSDVILSLPYPDSQVHLRTDDSGRRSANPCKAVVSPASTRFIGGYGGTLPGTGAAGKHFYLRSSASFFSGLRFFLSFVLWCPLFFNYYCSPSLLFLFSSFFCRVLLCPSVLHCSQIFVPLVKHTHRHTHTSCSLCVCVCVCVWQTANKKYNQLSHPLDPGLPLRVCSPGSYLETTLGREFRRRGGDTSTSS
jgi:hypothetical protein